MYHGAPLSETCVLCGRRPPRFLCFALSGSLCNLAQLGLDRALLYALEAGWLLPQLERELIPTVSVHASLSYA